jgi:hypothetical protein
MYPRIEKVAKQVRCFGRSGSSHSGGCALVIVGKKRGTYNKVIERLDTENHHVRNSFAINHTFCVIPTQKYEPQYSCQRQSHCMHLLRSNRAYNRWQKIQTQRIAYEMCRLIIERNTSVLLIYPSRHPISAV